MLPWCWISCDATACWRESVSVDKDSPTGSCSRSSSSATNYSLPTSSLKDSWTARRRARKWCVTSLRLCSLVPSLSRHLGSAVSYSISLCGVVGPLETFPSLPVSGPFLPDVPRFQVPPDSIFPPQLRSSSRALPFHLPLCNCSFGCRRVSRINVGVNCWTNCLY